MSAVPEVNVYELKALLDVEQPLTLLDVREPDEHDAGNLKGLLIPLMQLPTRLEELREVVEGPLVVYCRSGSRSAHAVSFLMQMGFENVKNLRGGMLEWRREIDPGVQVY